MRDNKKDFSKFFSFHGADLEDKGHQLQGECLLCNQNSRKDGVGRFFANKENGKWDCKECGRKGNQYTFLQMLYELRWQETTGINYKALSSVRGEIPAKAFEDAELAFNPREGKWLIPAYNDKGVLSNLYTWTPGSRLLSSPFCSHQLLQFPLVEVDENSPIFLCEGHWDTISLSWLLKRTKTKGNVLGVPGAEVLKDRWLEYFKDMNVFLLYDNDAAGERGISIAIRKLTGIASSIQKIKWSSSFPEKTDIGDIIAEKVKSPVKAFKIITKMLEEVELDQESLSSNRKRVRDGAPPSLEKLVLEFKKHWHVSKKLEEVILVILAVILSNFLSGDPLWLFLVGPPGAGKTALLESFGGSALAHFESSLTSQTLVSGYSSSEATDPSLVDILRDKCLVLKDWTEVQGLPHQVQEQLFSTFRGLYDGYVRRRFGNGVIREYEGINFSMVAGATDVIRGDDRATLGERFLLLECLSINHNPEKHIRAAIATLDHDVKVEHQLREIVADFLDRDYDKFRPSRIPPWAINRIVALSQILAYLRAGVVRDRLGNMVHRPRPEVGTRLAKQLVKLCRSLCIVRNSAFTMSTYKIMENVALDTVKGWTSDILHSCMFVYQAPCWTEDLIRDLEIAPSTLRRKLQDMLALGILTRISLKKKVTTGRGGNTFAYLPADQIVRLWTQAKLPTRGNEK